MGRVGWRQVGRPRVGWPRGGWLLVPGYLAQVALRVAALALGQFWYVFVATYDLAAYTPVGLYGYQWQLARARIVLFDSRRDPPPDTEWVVAGLAWPQARQAGGRRVWAHPAHGQALWRLPPPGAGYDSPASPLRGTTSSGRAERRRRREETPPSRTRRRGP